ncbi:hypothetical protein HK101_002768 [Irineochytrium annulatum]|nr:hypothetical protein HK101_002768 [Irineochytrium annulatum]
MGEVDDELAGEVDSIVQPGAGSAMQTAEDDAPKAAAAAPKALPVVDNNKPPTTGLVYDVRLLGHSQPYSLSSQGKVEYPEIPERIRGIYMELRRRGIKDRCQMIKAVTADSVGDGQDPLRLVHSARLVRNLEKSQSIFHLKTGLLTVV